MESFGVKAVVRLTGINENTLRGWERRYNAVTPERDTEGHRFYSEKDVERIKALWSLVREGHPIGKIAQLSDQALKKLLKKSLSPQGAEYSAEESRTREILNEIVRSLQKFDLEALNQILQKARFEVSSKEIIVNLIRPLMEEVGRLVYQDKITISQEHLLSSLLRDYLGNLNQSLSPYDFSARKKGPSVILTTREGDIHEFGIFMSSILCNLYRLRTYYLGPNMPVHELAEAVMKLNVDFIILGMMKLPMDREIISAEAYLKELDKRLPRKVSFYFGGSQDVNLSAFKSERVIIRFNSLNDLDHFLCEQA